MTTGMLIPSGHLIRGPWGARWIELPSGRRLFVRVLRTAEEMAAGMRGKTSFEGWDGLLFVHSEPGFFRYTMKGVLLPLDIIFLDDRGLVVCICEMNPGPRTIENKYPARFVLELPRGTASTGNLLLFRSRIEGVAECA